MVCIFFNAFTLNILGLPGEKGERGSPGIGTRGQRGLPGPPGMSSCNLTPPHFNRSISMLIISRVCVHTCLFKAFRYSLSKTFWLMEPVLMIVNMYLTTVISMLSNFHITMFIILRVFRHDRWTWWWIIKKWMVCYATAGISFSKRSGTTFSPWIVRIGWLKSMLTPLQNCVMTVGIKRTLRVWKGCQQKVFATVGL